MVAQQIRGLMVRRAGLFLIAALIGVSILAACGGSESTPALISQPGSAGVTTTTDVATSTDEVGDSASANTNESVSSTAPTGAGLTALVEEIDENAIVAAQEAVLIRLYEDLLPSVVHIRVSQRVELGESPPSFPQLPGVPLPDFPEDFFQQGEGSGFVWDQEGHIVTNYHVIQGADRVTVFFADRTELEAEVIGTDPDSDLAVLELTEPKADARPVELGDSDTLKVGQMALAIGNPFGQEFTMTSGIVSALGRTIRSGSSTFSIPEVIQADTPINPGNSGGPLLDRHGRVIGVNTQIISRSGVSSGVGFAVPINTAKQIIPALIEDGRYEYSWLGISGVTLSPAVADQMDLPRNTGGALVIQVIPDSPAGRAGLQGSNGTFAIDGVDYSVGGDVIVGIDKLVVQDMSDLIAFLVSNTRPGDKVILDVIRDGQGRSELEVTLGKRPVSEQ